MNNQKRQELANKILSLLANEGCTVSVANNILGMVKTKIKQNAVLQAANKPININI